VWEEKNNLEVLEELTNALSLKRMSDLSGNHVEYRAQVGTVLGFGLFKDGEVGIQRAFMSKGSIIHPHFHPEWEIVIVYHGKLKFRYDSKEQVIGVNEYIVFANSEPHDAEALEDTWMIAVTIPASEGYPNAPSSKGQFSDAG